MSSNTLVPAHQIGQLQYMLLFDQSTMRIIYCVWYVFSTW